MPQDELGKQLVVRTFIHRPSEIEWVGEGLRRAADLTLTAMTKDVPQDFEPYYPPDPLFGVLPHAHIMEADAAGEYWGRSVRAVPCSSRPRAVRRFFVV